MAIQSIFKSVLVGISYYSLKKIMDKLPAPYRKAAVFCLRACVFFFVFLTLFAFLSGRVSAIAQNVDAVPKLIVNIMLGFVFFISLIVAFLMTAVLEEIYRRLSLVHRFADEKVTEAKKTAAASAEGIKGSVSKTKRLFKSAGQSTGRAAKSLYRTSQAVTNATVDKTDRLIKKIVKKENT